MCTKTRFSIFYYSCKKKQDFTKMIKFLNFWNGKHNLKLLFTFKIAIVILRNILYSFI